VKSVYAWYYEVSKCAPQEALRNLAKAYQRFFKKQAKHPVFQKKGRRDSFYLEGKIQAKNSKIKLPRFGWVRLAENVNFEGIKNATISRKANHWFVSFRVPLLKRKENYKIKSIENKEVVGIDLGVKNLATLSDGTIFPNLRPYKKYKHKLKIEQRKLAKKFKKGQPQSNNYKKQLEKVSKIHYKIACIRQDALHKLTTYLAKNHSQIVIEDLNVSGMSKNRKLASAILDGGFYEFRRQLEYKTDWYGSELVVADRFYPSSKTCSSCGHVKKDLKLSERIYHCEKCNIQIDRDLNASINLKNWR